MKKRNGFTLLELMIAIGIISILSAILFRTFATVSEVAFRVEQEKNVTQEIISFSQILQNYADNNQIDYYKYQ
ncbi:type II secretion system protein [bacterium]|nr:type II secretion system protein [bacterium]